jgi:predicted GIY-YIG superfamily endonuclease/uncharacterized protein YktB (UPF0637 family)
MPFVTPIRLLNLLVVFAILIDAAEAQTAKKDSNKLQKQIDRAVVDAFSATHDGWSSDEVILQDSLNEAFLAKCRKSLSGNADLEKVSNNQLNWRLMNLRKAGKLKSKTTKRKNVDYGSIAHIAEIVARSMSDKHQCSIDRMMCDTEMRKEFNDAAKSIDDSIDAYTVRKAAFQLRKARRLKPELIGRIADWGREIKTHQLKDILENPKLINEHPGIYIFRDSSGYLYIGQTDNLRKRLADHLDESHNRSLAKYLKSGIKNSISIEVHDFDPESKASETRVRRAYESELIASRKPRFNLQP